jgi:putative DNA primase/helicase
MGHNPTSYPGDGVSPLSVVLSCLHRVKRSGSGYTAQCPAHDDRHNSLSIGEGRDGRVLLMCMAGCSTEDVLFKLGLTMRDLFDRRADPVRNNTKTNGRGGAAIPPKNGATPQQSPPPAGCTLAQYAEAKGLPLAFLQSLGLRDIVYQKAPAIRMPYLNENREEVAVRYRIALDKSSEEDNRFRWKSGARLLPYGLHRLIQARKAGYTTVPEGESDCHTLWYVDEPAQGLPGANLWREEWATYFEGIPIIFVVIESDQGGQAVRRWLASSSIRDRVRLVRLGEHKDPSELYLSDREHFKENWKAALEAAIPWTVEAQAKTEAKSRQAWETCKELATAPDIMSRFTSALA